MYDGDLWLVWILQYIIEQQLARLVYFQESVYCIKFKIGQTIYKMHLHVREETMQFNISSRVHMTPSLSL